MKNILLTIFSFSTLFAELTTEEKVGQILMFAIHGEDFSKEMEDVIKSVHPGGIILYNWANKLTDLEKIKNLTKNLQIHSSIPLFIGIDQEGGRIDRLNLGSPSAKQIGSSLNQDVAMTSAIHIGKALKKIGINLNFAPVVDINSNPENIVIGNRSFGSDPFLVTEFARRFMFGLTSSKIMGCLKHFPGHGDTAVDSHFALPVCLKSLDELMLCELIPYQKLAPLTPFIMTAHILFPNIDPNNLATLSKIFLQDILREKLNYRGLIITDSLRMGAILTNNLTDIAIKAFNAGNDILLIGGNSLTENDPEYNVKQIKDLHKNLVEAVKDGRISIKRLEESLARIKYYKNLFIKSDDLSKLKEPYSSLEKILPFDDHGWYSNGDMIAKCIKDHGQIEVAIEVGCWLGSSTRHIGSLLNTDAKLYAVDFWLGCLETEPGGINFDPQVYKKHATCYEQFLSNTIHSDLTDIIIPIKMESGDAAKSLNVKADFIYLDATHSTDAVYRDICLWYPKLKEGGIFCGDDWEWDSVKAAVNRFAHENSLKIYSENQFWRLIK